MVIVWGIQIFAVYIFCHPGDNVGILPCLRLKIVDRMEISSVQHGEIFCLMVG